MLNFTVGPVQMDDQVRKIGSEQVPYFRTDEFSTVMLENDRLLKELAGASSSSRAVFITGSGTASMEAAVMNCLTTHDKVLVVDGGSFGHRFCELMDIHSIPYEALVLERGQIFTEADLAPYAQNGFTAFVLNMGETSTGVLYDMELVAQFCHDNNLFLITDAISSFLADEVHMAKWGIDVLIIGSQKGLAVPPGASALVLSETALDRVQKAHPVSMYFDLTRALANAERGQTPFTPAVGILLQINERLREVTSIGLEEELARVRHQAEDFRQRIEGMPFHPFAAHPSCAVTSLEVEGFSARDLFVQMKDVYHMWVCPNGGELADRVFRVGHIGNLAPSDNAALIEALKYALDDINR